MAEKISDLISREFSEADSSSNCEAKLTAYRNRLESEALNYLRSKFPNAEDTAFFTDEWGKRHEHVVEAESVCEAGKIDYACSHCGDGECLLPDKFKDKRSRPVVLLCDEEGIKYLCMRWTNAIKCTNENENGEFMRFF